MRRLLGWEVEALNQLSLCTAETCIFLPEEYSLVLKNSLASCVLFHVVCEASLASVSADLLYSPVVLM